MILLEPHGSGEFAQIAAFRFVQELALEGENQNFEGRGDPGAPRVEGADVDGETFKLSTNRVQSDQFAAFEGLPK